MPAIGPYSAIALLEVEYPPFDPSPYGSPLVQTGQHNLRLAILGLYHDRLRYLRKRKYRLTFSRLQLRLLLAIE